MKLVAAIIKPFMLDDVKEALLAINVRGLTVSEVKGFGQQRGHSEIYGNETFVARFVPKLKIEVLATSEEIDKIVETIMTSARTGDTGDGKVYVHELDLAARIRTGERDRDAI